LEGRERVTLGIRPAHLLARPDDAGAFVGQVQLVEYLGNEVLVSIGDGPGSEIAALVHSAQAPRLGERVRFGIDATQLHLFDAQTGASLRRAAAEALH
ncbi:TOBE domain-containing protein, partial [Variovorax sp. CT11-76]